MAATALEPRQNPSRLVPGPPEAARRLGLALAIIAAAQLMVVLDATIVNIALPSIQRALHFSAANLAWVINSYAVAFGGLLLLGGRAGDLFGRRRVFMAGIAIFTLGSLAGGFATTSAWLIVARAVQGVGGAIAAPTALALIADSFPEGGSRNRAMGVYSAMAGTGGAVGLLLGGILTDLASWRWVMFVNVPIGLLVLALTPRVLPSISGRPGRLDLPGALSAAGGMSALVFGLSRAATYGWGDTVTLATLAAAGTLLSLFVLIEARSSHPLMPLRIFANRNRTGAYLVMLGLGAGVFATFFFVTQFVQDILGFTPLAAGLGFLPLSATIVATATVTSRLVGRVGRRLPLTVGPLLAAVALLWLSRLGVHSTYVGGVLGPMLVLAVGMGMTFVPLMLTAVSGAAGHEAGLASALVNTGQQIGGSIGLAVLVTVATTVTRGMHAVPATPGSVQAVAAGYSTAFEVGAAIALGAFLAGLAFVRGPRPALEVERLGVREAA
ncbi:MAG: MFS transporter [Candidatus Dormibacterales bacterium]